MIEAVIALTIAGVVFFLLSLIGKELWRIEKTTFPVPSVIACGIEGAHFIGGRVYVSVLFLATRRVKVREGQVKARVGSAKPGFLFASLDNGVEFPVVEPGGSFALTLVGTLEMDTKHHWAPMFLGKSLMTSLEPEDAGWLEVEVEGRKQSITIPALTGVIATVEEIREKDGERGVAIPG